MFHSVTEEFELQCRIQNKPYDIFGTWFNKEYVISGELRWLSKISAVSESKLWLNKVTVSGWYGSSVNSGKTLKHAASYMPDRRTHIVLY